ncbi:MAG: UDP-N-acetylmuramoyl-tripeptide--D-alanyl-D-alanine ligase [Spirochaetales bacterium]|nr:UDP-N-acetylmuramoyl-tripeptide--D-alanyl-D-alanine ligase [Spirochaetales bacterium]
MTGLKQEALFTIEELINCAGGKAVFLPDRVHPVCSFVIDSRKAEESSLFVPLKGEHTDGHEFLAHAVSGGARALFVAEAIWQIRKNQILFDLKDSEVSIIMVKDPLKAFQDCARVYLNRFSSLCRIGITGSNGKTTTKEITGSILSQKGKTLINQGNLNSEIGLPLSVFRVQPDHHFGVFEMGMNHKGEMDILSDIVKPDAAVITNIGVAHIGILGSKDAIAGEKKRIFTHFNGNQTAYIYEDEPYFSFLSKGVKGRIIPYGLKSTKGFTGYEDRGLDGMTINWEGFRVLFPLFGFHNLLNALGALTLARELGIGNREIIDGLEGVTPLFGRSQVVKGRITIIQDCYNSNPDSVKEALEFLGTVSWKGRRIAVLGSMLELGRESENAHLQILHDKQILHLDRLYLFGPEFEKPWSVYLKGKKDIHSFWTDDFSSLVKELKENVQEGDLLLLKGSRGIELERLVPELRTGKR